MDYFGKLNNRKLYYLPGLISLLLLPVFFIPRLIQKQRELKPLYVIEMNLRPLQKSTSVPSMQDEWEIPDRKFTRLICQKNSGDIRKKMDLGLDYMNEIVANKDTVHGVEFLIKDVQYGDFIYLLNGFLKHKFKTYTLLGDTIRILYAPLPMPSRTNTSSKNRVMCGTADIRLRKEYHEAVLQKKEELAAEKIRFLWDRGLYLMMLTAAYFLIPISYWVQKDSLSKSTVRTQKE